MGRQGYRLRPLAGNPETKPSPVTGPAPQSAKRPSPKPLLRAGRKMARGRHRSSKGDVSRSIVLSPGLR